MKPIEFAGDSLERLRAFPATARRGAGYQLDRVQRGLEPDDWKPMQSDRCRAFANCAFAIALSAFRVIYLATLVGSDRGTCTRSRRKRSEPRSTGYRTWRPSDFASLRQELTPKGLSNGTAEIRKRLGCARRYRGGSGQYARALGTDDCAANKDRGLEGQPGRGSASDLGLTQPRLNDLMRGRIDKFSLDALVNLAAPAGLVVRLQVRKAA